MTEQDSEYYAQARPEMLEFIPTGTRRLLDIGCGQGRFGEAVKRKLPACETWGIEPVAEAATAAAGRNDRIINGTVEAINDLPKGHFDVITMNDVLEHIDYSEPVLATVKTLLRPGGRLVLSLPNVRFYLHLRDLIFHKDWEYKDFGILDRTHLRFFTQKSATRLLMESGYRVDTCKGINTHRLKFHYGALFALAPQFFEDMRYRQMALVALPVN